MSALPQSCLPREKIEEDCYDWYQRHRQCLELAATGPYEAVLIGDSLTHFWTEWNGPESWREFFDGHRVLNLGFGWDRTPNVLWRLAHGEFPIPPPPRISLNLGSNNLVTTANYAGDSPEETARGIEEVVRTLRALAPASRIIVHTIFPRGTSQDPVRRKIRELNTLLKVRVPQWANAELLDLSERFLRPGGELDTSLFCPDLCHPNEAGYRLWGKALRPLLFFE